MQTSKVSLMPPFLVLVFLLVAIHWLMANTLPVWPDGNRGATARTHDAVVDNSSAQGTTPPAQNGVGMNTTEYINRIVLDLRRRAYSMLPGGFVLMVAVILTILYRFMQYDRQIRALIRNQKTFDLIWGDLKTRRIISKGNHPFFRLWGMNISTPACSMNELSDGHGWSYYDDSIRAMTEMKAKDVDFLITDQKVIAPGDGTNKYYRCYRNRLDDHRFMSCVQDMTDLYEAEIQERFLLELFGAINDGILFLDRDMRILKHNKAVEDIVPLMQPKEKICYKAFTNRWEPCPGCPVKRTWEDGKRHRKIYFFKEKNQWIELFSYPIRDPNSGEVVRVLEIIRDITQQRHWENSILEREQYLTAILESSNDGIIAISEIDGKSHVNTRFLEMFGGGTPEEFCKNASTEKFLDVHRKISPNWEDINDARLLAIRTREPQSGMLRLFDGRYYEWNVNPVHLGLEGRSGMTRIWTYRDVTDRLKAAAAIQQSEIKFRAIFESSQNGSALYDTVTDAAGLLTDFQFTDVNPAWEKIYRQPKQSLVGRNLTEFFSKAKITDNGNNGTQQAVASIFDACSLAMEGRPGHYTVFLEPHNAYYRVTVFKTETNQLAIFVTDDTARILDERSLRSMQTLIDHLSEPVIQLTREGNIRYANNACREALGFQHADLVFGQKIWPYDTKMLTEEHWQELLGKLDTEDYQRFDTRLKRVDGQEFPADVVMNLMEHEGQCLVAACFRDLSEQVRRIEAEQAYVAKSRFLNQMSHELMTPLNGILVAIEVVMQTELSTKQQEFASIVHKSAKNLLQILAGILAFSDIQAHKIELHYSHFDLRGMIYSVIAQVVEKLEAKDPVGRIAFHVHLSTALPCYLIGDMQRLISVFIALFDNAVKFTERGSITWTLADDGRTSCETGATFMLHVEIADTGSGISPETMQNLFEPFVLGDSSFSREQGGTGLGLVVAKGIISQMGGHIHVESKEETGILSGGSTFRIHIPLAIDGNDYMDAKSWTARDKTTKLPQLSPPSSVTPEPAEMPENTLDTPTILLVEDNRINQLVVMEILKNSGFSYDLAENGEKACEKVAEKAYALVLMDCQMPIMDGFEATRTIRQMEAGVIEKVPAHTGHLPIVALTANALSGDEEACLEAGMDAFCSKPIDKTHLLAVMRDLL